MNKNDDYYNTSKPKECVYCKRRKTLSNIWYWFWDEDGWLPLILISSVIFFVLGLIFHDSEKSAQKNLIKNNIHIQKVWNDIGHNDIFTEQQLSTITLCFKFEGEKVSVRNMYSNDGKVLINDCINALIKTQWVYNIKGK